MLPAMANYEDFEPDFQHEQDKTLLVKFYMRRSPTNGKIMEYISIRVPGTRDVGYAGPARQDHVKRFPAHYRAFKERSEAPNAGYPLKDWSLITPERAEELSFVNVKTVEQLADISDGHAGNIMGMYELKKQATEWLVHEKERSKARDLRAELAARDDKINALTEKLDAFMAATTGTKVAAEKTEEIIAEEEDDDMPRKGDKGPKNRPKPKPKPKPY